MYREWLGLSKGEKFDLNVFDLDEANKQIVALIDFMRENTKE